MQTNRFMAQITSELREILDDFKKPRFYRMLLSMVIGISVTVVAINGILIPNHFFSGGTSGLTLIYFYLMKWPSVGVLYLIANIPLFLIGWREYALRYVFISLVGVLMFSGGLELTQWLVLPIPDPLIAAILAGVMVGGGVGFYLREGGSAGGLDILAKYIRKRFGLPMGTTINTVNFFNLIGAWLIFDLKTAFYSGVYLFVMAAVLEKAQTGMSQHRAALIITAHPDLASQRIRGELERGVTFLQAVGGFSGQPLRMLYTVINLYELGRLKQIMFDIDPQAFVTVMDAAEVIGQRFRTFEEEGYRRPFTWEKVYTQPQMPPAETPTGLP